MKKWLCAFWMPLVLCIFFGCGPKEPSLDTAEPIFQNVSCSAVLFTDFDETWYELVEGDGGFEEATAILASIRGVEMEPPDDGPAGWYDFAVTYEGENHSLSLTGNYCVVDGSWYLVEENYGLALAECLRETGRGISKEEWSQGEYNPVSSDSSASDQETDYFRDCERFEAKFNTICYAELPWADTLSFCEQENRLQEAGAIPTVEDFQQFDASACYDAAGSVSKISCKWYTQRMDEYRTLCIDIYRETPEQGEQMDGYYYDLGESVTETQVDGVTVYGVFEEKQDGTPIFDHCLLVATLPDGSVCQISGVGERCREDTTIAMDFLLQNGVRYEEFRMELGDRYTWASLDSHPELFPGCIPDFSGLPLYYNGNQKPIRLKNGVPTEESVEFALEYLEKQDSIIQWSVFREPSDFWMEYHVGQLELLTEEKLLEQLEEHRICFQTGGYYISVNFGDGIPTAVAAALIESLPGFSGDGEPTDVQSFLAQDDGPSGERLGSCGTGVELYSFSGQIGELLSENALPVVHGYFTPEIYGTYDTEGQLSELSMTWTAQDGTSIIDLSISPAHIQGVLTYEDGTSETITGTEPVAYSTDLQDCVTMEIGGVTIYGDGTPVSEKQALLWQLEDGTLCQLYMEGITDFTTVGRILDFVLDNGIDKDAFGKDRGKLVGIEELSEDDTRFLFYAPRELWEKSGTKNIHTKAGDVSKVFLVYENHNQIQFSWQILFQPTAQDVANCLGWFDEFTKEEFVSAIQEHGDTAGFWYMDGYIQIYAFEEKAVDTMWELIEALREQAS